MVGRNCNSLSRWIFSIIFFKVQVMDVVSADRERQRKMNSRVESWLEKKRNLFKKNMLKTGDFGQSNWAKKACQSTEANDSGIVQGNVHGGWKEWPQFRHYLDSLAFHSPPLPSEHEDIPNIFSGAQLLTRPFPFRPPIFQKPRPQLSPFQLRCGQPFQWLHVVTENDHTKFYTWNKSPVLLLKLRNLILLAGFWFNWLWVN